MDLERALIKSLIYYEAYAAVSVEAPPSEISSKKSNYGGLDKLRTVSERISEIQDPQRIDCLHV